MQLDTTRSFGVAVRPSGDIGYRAVGTGVEILDLTHFLSLGTLSIPDTLGRPTLRATLLGWPSAGMTASSPLRPITASWCLPRAHRRDSYPNPLTNALRDTSLHHRRRQL